jgi:hypothetical protein
MAEEKKYMMPMIAIVAIVAIVGIVMLFMQSKGVEKTYTPAPEPQLTSEELMNLYEQGNLAGQAPAGAALAVINNYYAACEAWAEQLGRQQREGWTGMSYAWTAFHQRCGWMYNSR